MNARLLDRLVATGCPPIEIRHNFVVEEITVEGERVVGIKARSKHEGAVLLATR